MACRVEWKEEDKEFWDQNSKEHAKLVSPFIAGSIGRLENYSTGMRDRRAEHAWQVQRGEQEIHEIVKRCEETAKQFFEEAKSSEEETQALLDMIAEWSDEEISEEDGDEEDEGEED